MLTCRGTFKLCEKFRTGTSVSKVKCINSIFVNNRNSKRNICSNQLKPLSSQLQFHNDVSTFLLGNSYFSCNKDTKKYYRRNKLYTPSLFSSCNVRNFSSTSVCLSDNDYRANLDVLSKGDSPISTSTVAGNVQSSELGESVNLESSAELLEPSFSSLGLGGWTPPGLVQSGLEFLHITCDLPWWACIFCGTVIIRTAVLPLVIRFQKSMTVMTNAMPQIQLLQMKMINARDSGNVIEATRYSNEMINLVKTKKINPLKSAVLPLIQMPFFLSFFFGLRGMAELPVDSLHNGGLWWFTDLTVCDPYYLLPVATCLTMFITVELGLETGVSPNQVAAKPVKYILRAMPFVMFPIIIHFPGVILVYWLSTNVYSLVQSSVMRIRPVRDFFGFEAPINNTESFNILEKMKRKSDVGFKEEFRESLTNMKVSQDLMERKSLEMEMEDKFNKMKRDVSKKNEQKL